MGAALGTAPEFTQKKINIRLPFSLFSLSRYLRRSATQPFSLLPPSRLSFRVRAVGSRAGVGHEVYVFAGECPSSSPEFEACVEWNLKLGAKTETFRSLLVVFTPLYLFARGSLNLILTTLKMIIFFIYTVLV